MLYFWLDYPIQGVPEIQKKFLCQNMWRKEIDGVTFWVRGKYARNMKCWVKKRMELSAGKTRIIEESKEAILSENGKLVKASNF